MGATVILHGAVDERVISIHAPVWERLPVDAINYAGKAFQSTLPYGSDNSIPVAHRYLLISIHAPVWERQVQENMR